MKKLSLGILLTLFTLSGYTQPGILFYDDAEASNKPIALGTSTTNAANFSNGYSWIYANTSEYPAGTIARSNIVARKGTWSYRHILVDLAGSEHNVWQSLKAEMAWGFAPAGTPAGQSGANNRAPSGLKYYAVSTYIPTSSNDNTSITSVGLVMKSWPDNYNTPSYLSMERGRFYLFVTPINSSNVDATPVKYDCGPVVKGTWDDWVLERNFTNQDSGYVRLYRNNPTAGYNKTLVASRNGGNWKVGSSWSKESYLMTGLYKWAFRSDWYEPAGTTSTEMFTDEIKVGIHGATLESMWPDFTTAPPNASPTVSTAANALTSTSSSRTLTATAADSDGTIASYSWTRISGPNTPSLSGQTTSVLNITGMVDGTYTYRVIVTDDDGATAESSITITKTAINNNPPEVEIGDGGFLINQTSIQPNVVLSDDITPMDSLITQWTQVSGKTLVASDWNIPQPTFSGLQAGYYVMRLDVIDGDGAVTSKFFEWKVIVRVSRIRMRSNKSPITATGTN